MHLFLAIEPPEEIKQLTFEKLSVLRDTYKSYSWVEPKDYLLTLHHFGPFHEVKSLALEIKDLLLDQKKLYLSSRGLDLTMREKISIYTTFYRDKELEKIVEKIKEKWGKKNANSLSFAPHLPVGSCRIPSKQQYFLLKKKLENTKLEVEFLVDKIFLYESIQDNSTANCKKVEEFSLL
jgi:2'-5' RNA ligase